jgi:hypothetical protein
MESFYATVTSFNFVLMGLWWGVVQSRRAEWLGNPRLRSLATGVYQSFLIPGVMSLAAQLGQESKLLWQIAFLTAAVAGGVLTTMFLLATEHTDNPGWFRRNQWIVVTVYTLIAIFAVFPDLSYVVGLKPLQLEGILISALVFFGVSFAWELQSEASSQAPKA